MKGIIVKKISKWYPFLLENELRDDLNQVISYILYIGKNMPMKDFLRMVDRELYKFSVQSGFKAVKVISCDGYKNHWTKWGFRGVYVPHFCKKSQKRFCGFISSLTSREEI